jgi:hypothetical protein
MTGEPWAALRRRRRQSRGISIAKASSGTATPMLTPMPMPVQSLFAPGWASAADAAVVEMVSTIVDVPVVDSSVLLSVVVTTGLAFVVIDERDDDGREDVELDGGEFDGDELGEFDDGEEDVEVVAEEVEEESELDTVEVEEAAEVSEDVVPDERLVPKLVEEVAAADTVTAAPKSQLFSRNNELLLLQHCETSSTQQ